MGVNRFLLLGFDKKLKMQIKLYFISPVGQAWVLQFCDSMEIPWKVNPSSEGAGLLQALVRFRMPPQVSLRAP